MGVDQELLKRLRRERRAQVEAARARLKVLRAEMKQVRRQLAAGPATVPQMAEQTGLDPARVLWLVTALRKYGLAVEGDKQGDYYTYRLTETAAQTGAEKG